MNIIAEYFYFLRDTARNSQVFFLIYFQQILPTHVMNTLCKVNTRKLSCDNKGKMGSLTLFSQMLCIILQERDCIG